MRNCVSGSPAAPQAKKSSRSRSLPTSVSRNAAVKSDSKYSPPTSTKTRSPTPPKGLYHRDHLQRLSTERIMRFFTPEGPQHLRISGELRRHVIFSRHNVIEDPPFTRLHLVSCRNLLIYLNSRSQRVAFASFHFALRPHGLACCSAQAKCQLKWSKRSKRSI